MSRKRNGAVRERPEELEALLDRCRDDALRTRARMLIELQASPQLTYADLAGRLGYHEKTVRRWWSVYRSHGIGSLMSLRERPPSAPTIRYEYRARATTAPAIPSRLLRFLNGLPRALDTTEWLTGFKACLEDILDGVDRVSVAVDLGSDLEHPGTAEPAVMVTQHHSIDDELEAPALTSRTMVASPAATFIEQMIAGGFPIERYGRPYAFDYYIGGVEWLGTIVLWRRRGGTIPQSTLALLRSLEEFMVFLLSDCVSRRLRRDPQLRDFQSVVNAVASEIRLTRRELQVFALQATGFTREAIAERLGIVIGTVDKHISRIHAKAGTGNYTELFARHFTSIPGT